MSSSNLSSSFRPALLSKKTIQQRVAARVAERNSWPTFRFPAAGDIAKFLCTHLPQVVFRRGIPTQEQLDVIFPVTPVNFDVLRRPPPDRIQVTWVGHATTLVQLGGVNVLTDPIFSRRCSAFQWAGPERYRRPAFTVRDLERENVSVDVVLISHNHYDHLDYASVRDLAGLGGVTFVVPLGLRDWFVRNIPRSLTAGCRVVELDWHESCSVDDVDATDTDFGGRKRKLEVRVTAVPMQHWSNRTGFDRDESLWCGFIISARTKDVEDERTGQEGREDWRSTQGELKCLFAGDTGWFDGLHDIGKRYGPFNVAAIPIGAYEPATFMRPTHMNPEDAVRMMNAVNAQRAVPIHWGTFKLTVEPVMEPRERLLVALGAEEKERECFIPLCIGDIVSLP